MRLRLRYIVIFIVIVLVASAVLFFTPARESVTSLYYQVLSSGSVSKDKALATNCNKDDSICVLQDGKLVTQKITSKESGIQKKQNNEKTTRVDYATNVSQAVHAIRKYTKIPNLDVMLMENSTPANISFYCTKDSKCWAVDNKTHQVVPGDKQ